MPSDVAVPHRHQRTVEEAIAQANAKERIRSALGVRAAGVTATGLGVMLLLRFRTWRPIEQAVSVHVHGGPSLTLSLAAIIGAGAVVAGPIIGVVGHWLLRRATTAARANPVTAGIFDQPGITD